MTQVAQRAGVACSTVSKAFHNNQRIPEQTRIRIRKIAEEMGYTPNPVVSNLMAQLRHIRRRKTFETIAWITAFPERDIWESALSYREYYEGARNRALELGFNLEKFWFGDADWKGKRLSTILRTRSIRGVLIAPVPEVTLRIDLEWDDFAVATFGYSLREPLCHRVTNHQFHSMLRLLRRLDEGGFRRIGLVFNPMGNYRTGSNFTAGMITYQLHIPPENRIPFLYTSELTSQQFNDWYIQHKPEVLIAHRQVISPHLAANNIRTPEDVSVAYLVVGREDKESAGIFQRSQYIGVAAVELIAEQLYENRLGIPACQKTILVEGEYKEGASVRFPGSNRPSIDWNLLI